mmetsp:Transcript_37188/g.86458  ORF Transcript_37188/g.86458 Transcript_37188/m.86458 type:complete len:268 (-) Transcript_37188:96-899(-)
MTSSSTRHGMSCMQAGMTRSLTYFRLYKDLSPHVSLLSRDGDPLVGHCDHERWDTGRLVVSSVDYRPRLMCKGLLSCATVWRNLAVDMENTLRVAHCEVVGVARLVVCEKVDNGKPSGGYGARREYFAFESEVKSTWGWEKGSVHVGLNQGLLDRRGLQSAHWLGWCSGHGLSRCSGHGLSWKLRCWLRRRGGLLLQRSHIRRHGVGWLVVGLRPSNRPEGRLWSHRTGVITIQFGVLNRLLRREQSHKGKSGRNRSKKSPPFAAGP